MLIVGNWKIQELIVLFHLVLNPSRLEIGFNVKEGLEILVLLNKTFLKGNFLFKLQNTLIQTFTWHKKLENFIHCKWNQFSPFSRRPDLFYHTANLSLKPEADPQRRIKLPPGVAPPPTVDGKGKKLPPAKTDIKGKKDKKVVPGQPPPSQPVR